MENTPANVVSIDAMMQGKVIICFSKLLRVSTYLNGYSIIPGFWDVKSLRRIHQINLWVMCLSLILEKFSIDLTLHIQNLR